MQKSSPQKRVDALAQLKAAQKMSRKKPATPKKRQDAEDIERADSEGMGQHQDTSPKRIMDKNRSQKRADALKQLIAAKKTLLEGQAELARAQEKIRKTTDLINESADVLRDTMPRRRN